jgi:hypothetical protein
MTTIDMMITKLVMVKSSVEGIVRNGKLMEMYNKNETPQNALRSDREQHHCRLTTSRQARVMGMEVVQGAETVDWSGGRQRPSL